MKRIHGWSAVGSTLLILAFNPRAQAQFSANNQTNTISGVTSNWMDNGTYVVGSNTFLDTLIIQSGGVLSNGTSYIGYEPSGSNNTAIVSDAGSAWSNSGGLFVGYQGASNQLIITNGGSVFSTNGYIGALNVIGNTNNTVLVTGTGSVWSNSGGLSIGTLSADNHLIIANGGRVVNFNTAIGDNPGASTNGPIEKSTVLVTGTNSVWMSGAISMSSDTPTNIITVSNGGAVFSGGTVVIGSSGNGDGNVVLVTDPGSIWSNALVLEVGGFGRYCQFIVSNGATAYSKISTISGNASCISNGVVVTGPGSTWSVLGPITIGGDGVGSFLIVTNGGFVQGSKVAISVQPGSSGALTIAGGTNENSVSLNVGTPDSTGTVTVASGALFVTNAVGSGVTVVNGSGSTLILGGGTFQTDNLIVSNGGVVQYVQTYEVSNATVTVAGGNIQAGANYVVAASANSTGTVNVTGGQLTVTNGVVGIGNNGTITSGSGVGQMTVSNGTLLVSSVVLGNNAGSQCDLFLADGGVISDGGCPSGTNCLVVINSKGSTTTGGNADTCATPWEIGVTAPGDDTVSGGTNSYQNFYAGFSNVGTFTLAGAGVVNVCAEFIVGHQGLDTSSVTATGAVWVTGGQLTMNSADSIVGNSGVGQMNISNGVVTAAQVTVGNSANASSFGTLTLAGGTLTVSSLVLPNPHSQFLFTGGWLNALGITNANGQMLTLGNGVNPITLNLLGGISSFSNGLKISTNSTVSGFGTITGAVVNFGLISLSNSVLTFTGGSLTNNGTIRAMGGSVIEAYGTVVNNGTIDIINGGVMNFHSTFVNHGTVLDAHSVRVSNTTISGNDVTVQIPSVAGHTYQLQTGSSLAATNWTTSGASQGGTGGVLSFTDAGGATNNPARFYRIQVGAQ